MTPTGEQVRKLAREADIIDWRDEDGDEHVEQMIDSLMVIWQAARAQALEDAKKECVKESESWAYPSHGNASSVMCAKLIDELKGKQ
jgi:spore cortex formation protein SpoVR/YcgB (stage V sporulation)